MFQKLKQTVVRSRAFQATVVASTAIMAPAVYAQAALPAGVDAAITNSGEVLVLGATAVIIAMVAFWGLRKLGSKMGWW
jgi:hypothetical protein